MENGGKLQWNLVDLCDLSYSARVVELINYNFPSLGWKITIGLLSTSALAAVTDELLDEVSQLLVLVGLAARQIGDVITGRAQASHK